MTLHVTLPDGSPLQLADGATVADAAAAIGPRLAKAAIAGRVTPATGSRAGAGRTADPAARAATVQPGRGSEEDGKGVLVDLSCRLNEGDQVAIVTLKSEDPEALDIMRHTAGHVMAQAVLRLFPGAKYAIGPTIENGFYYDIQLPQPLTDADLPRIEREMARIVRENAPIARHELPADRASAVFAGGEEAGRAREALAGAGASPSNVRAGRAVLAGGEGAAEAAGTPAGPAASSPATPAAQPFKEELIRDLVAAGQADHGVSLYTQGEFVDLCRGPHLPSTGKLGAFKLTSVAGAYWRGDEGNAMLTRIYGTAWPSQKELDAYLQRLEMARQRDHRRIGRDLDLFSFHEEGPGFPFFHPKGMRLWNAMVDFWRAEHVRAGYEEISTPVILRRELWERSGHWDNYKDNMYFTEIDEQPYAVKPMNCPGGLLIYKSRRRSYRDLPLRMAELGRVHRHEMSGVLHGLFRVRYFTQDDAHIYCTPEQLEDEVRGVLHFMLHIYSAFGFADVKIELSTRPEKSIGSDEMWERAESVLEKVLNSETVPAPAAPRVGSAAGVRVSAAAGERVPLAYQLNPGDGAFYGPKIDFHIRDVMGRTWQCGTIQVDFAMPERLDIGYTGADNEEHRPVMIHRALLGSIERFMGILLEHYGGNLPTWLAPEQVRVLPIADRHTECAHEVAAVFAGAAAQAGLHLWVAVDDRAESLGKRIREGQVHRVPYLLVVGDREASQKTVAVRLRGKDEGSRPVDEVVSGIVDEVRERRLPALGVAD
jgi:threonyl-tRNA synthetase